ncbi:MAG: hypothetical protein LWW96_02595 [Acidovorax sp.]|uniref:hypothetical protein n=1 Tax=Acidovorax sp. TaxID=1872122 RepID=UPI0025BF64DD|nr:hypothetical protein [Acidovorax sp.]MCE1191023.1 hypothetical protein [Acidovorax sp.]
MSPLISGLASIASMVFNAASGRSGGATPSARRADSADAAGPSAVVHLSPEAAALAGLADKGLMVTQGRLDSPVTAASRGAVRGGGGMGGGSVSAQDFQDLLAQFGASDAQKERLAAAFDADQNGRISQDEFLKGLAKTRSVESTDFSQAVMQLMDHGGNGNGDGTVAPHEFAAFSTAFAALQKRAAAGIA